MNASLNKKSAVKSLFFYSALSACVLMAGACSSDNKQSPDPQVSSSHSKDEAKPAKNQSSGPTRFVTTALTNDGGLEGSIPQQALSEVLLSLDEITRKESDNIPLMITYMGLLRLYDQNPALLEEVQRKTGMIAAKNPWFALEAGYAALKRREFSLADFLFDKAEKNSGGNPVVKAAVTHAYGMRLYVEGKTQLGIFEMKRAAQGETPFLPALLTVGFLGLKSGDYAGAERMFRSATSLAPNSLNSRLGLAAALRSRGKADEAVPILQALYRQRPNDRRIAWNYALALGDGNLGNQKQALEVLSKYFQTPGSFPDIDSRANALANKLTAAVNTATAAASAPPPASPAATPAGSASGAPATPGKGATAGAAPNKPAAPGGAPPSGK